MSAVQTGVKVKEVKIVVEVDTYPDLSHLGEFSSTPKEGAIAHHRGLKAYKYFNPENPEYGQQDYERVLAHNRGEWQMIGVYAEAYLVVNGTTQYIRTPGLWGIESDSGPDYIEQEVGSQEYQNLVEILAALGITENIPAWEDVDPAKHGE